MACPICMGELDDQGIGIPGILRDGSGDISILCKSCGHVRLSKDYVATIFVKEDDSPRTWKDIQNACGLIRFLHHIGVQNEDDFVRLKKALARYLQDHRKDSNDTPHLIGLDCLKQIYTTNPID